MNDITMAEAKQILKIVRTLLMTLAFTRDEFNEIVTICGKCLDRLEQEQEK